MVQEVSPDDIADYRSSARRAGRDTSHLSDSQIAEQIRILRGAIYAPSKSDLQEIRARAKRTEVLFRKSRDGALKCLKKASLQFGKLALRHSSSSRAGKVAKQVLQLHQSLLEYAPSMLSPEIRNAVVAVNQWAAIAKRFLEKGTRRDEVLISSIPGELYSLLEVIREKKGE